MQRYRARPAPHMALNPFLYRGPMRILASRYCSNILQLKCCRQLPVFRRLDLFCILRGMRCSESRSVQWSEALRVETKTMSFFMSVLTKRAFSKVITMHHWRQTLSAGEYLM